MKQVTKDQIALQVYPQNNKDKLMFPGLECDIWVQKGQQATQGHFYRERYKNPESVKGKVGLVLGAGNATCLPLGDILHKLITCGEVVILKYHEVLEYTQPYFDRMLEPFIKRGFIQTTLGGPEIGSFLAYNLMTESVHMTGSVKTHDRIVFGDDYVQKKTKTLTKPITSELGCCTPWIIVPSVATWNQTEIDYQARHLIGANIRNVGCDCNSGKIIITARGWGQRQQFIDYVAHLLSLIPPRYPYYPGTKKRYDSFIEAYKEHVRQIQPKNSQIPEGYLPWTMIVDIPPEQGSFCFLNEAFSPLLFFVNLDVGEPNAGNFLPAVTKFCNEQLWGTLSCSIVIDPPTEKKYSIEFQQTIVDLKYGGIAINCWSCMLICLVTPSWGAYPGQTLEDAGSGIGVVNNTFLIDYAEKSVLRSPFHFPSKLKLLAFPYFPMHSNLPDLMGKVDMYMRHPSWGNTIKIGLSALKGSSSI